MRDLRTQEHVSISVADTTTEVSSLERGAVGIEYMAQFGVFWRDLFTRRRLKRAFPPARNVNPVIVLSGSQTWSTRRSYEQRATHSLTVYSALARMRPVCAYNAVRMAQNVQLQELERTKRNIGLCVLQLED